MKKVLKIVGNVLLWLFVIFAVLVTVLVFTAQSSKDGLANVGGKSMISVVSDSMNPTFKKGDLIFDKILTNDEKSKCKVGDVITFYSDLNNDGNDEINTHRIVSVYKEDGYTYYITKGDNTKTNVVNDKTPVIYTKVLGKYTGTRLKSVGDIIAFLQTSIGFLCVIVVPLVLFFLFELYNFIVVIVRMKSKGAISDKEKEDIERQAIEAYKKQMEEKENSDSNIEE